MYSHSSFPPAPADQPPIDPALDDATPPPNNGVNGDKTEAKSSTKAAGTASESKADLPAPERPLSQRDPKSSTITDLTFVGLSMTPNAPKPPKPSTPLDDNMRSEIRYFYTQEYAPGIDAFLDTDWYVSIGIDILEKNEKMMTSFAEMLLLFEATKSDDYDQMRLLPGAEGRVVWSLMCLPRSFDHVAVDARLKDVQAKLKIIEHLITGQTTETNPYAGIETVQSQQDENANVFWKALAAFVSRPLPSEQVATKTHLVTMRSTLFGKENRDALYSMSVMRDILQRHPSALTPSHNRNVPTSIIGVSDDEQLAFKVAKRFVEDEAAGRGTTQVIQRLCGMAVRGWLLMGK